MDTTEQETAIDDAESEVRNRPTDSAAFEVLGMAYFEAHRLDEAMTAFERAKELNPGSAPAYNGIGRVRYHTGPAQAATDAYEQAITNDPHFIPAYYGLGILYAAQLGEYDRAIDAFERGLAANPADSFLTASLGSTYARKGQIEKAIGILEQAVKLDPGQAFAYSWLSLLYLHLKRYDEAAAACQRENECEESASSHRVLGYIYAALERNIEAIAALERAVALDPSDYEARGALSKAYRASGNLSAAEHHYNTAWEMAAQDNEYGQACFHAVSGDVDRALALLEASCVKGQVQPGWIRIDPEFAFIQDEPRFQALIS